jgi:hypothetical protein
MDYTCRNLDDSLAIYSERKRIFDFNTYSFNTAIKNILDSFGLIMINVSMNFPDHKICDSEDYNKLKDLLISIKNNGNCLEYKYYVEREGILIFDENKKIIFYDSLWTRFFYSVLDSFKIIGRGGFSYESVYRRD